MVAGVLATAGPAIRTGAAQQRFRYLGPKQCTNCHDHDAEKLWYEKKEIPEVHRLFPDQNNAGHINSLKQLEMPKSDDFAKAIGLADKYEATGACVACHGTVFGGEANAGVSCESCHGPGSGYRDPHQLKDSYEKSVTEYGMTRLIGNFAGWTQQCTNCHVMTDDRLIAAGHPSGDDFDLSKKFVPVSLHFKKTYEPADIAATARGEMQAVLRRRGRPTPTTATPTPAAAETGGAPAAPAETPTAPPAAPAPAGTPAAPPAASAASSAQTPAEASPPAGSSSPAAGTPSKATRPRAAAPRPAPIDPAAPPAGSPTSIEPPPPLESATSPAPPASAPLSASATAPKPSAAPASSGVAVATPGSRQYVWLGAAVAGLAIVIVGIVLARKRR